MSAAVVVDRSSGGRAPLGGWIIPALTRGALTEGARLGELAVVHHHGAELLSEVYTVSRAADGSTHTARVIRRAALARSPEIAVSLGLAARRLVGVRHRNLPAVLGAGWTDEATPRPFLVHERVAGRTLAAYVARHGALEGSLVLAIASQVAAALAALHERGLAHADVRAENVLLEPVGEGMRIRLGGFERVRAIGPADAGAIASDLAGLVALLRGLEGVAAAPELAPVLARVGAAGGIAGVSELRAALAELQIDPSSSASAISGSSLLEASPPTAPTASSSARWGARAEGRPFGQVSLRMTREPAVAIGARRAVSVLVLCVLTTLGVIAAAVGLRAEVAAPQVEAGEVRGAGERGAPKEVQVAAATGDVGARASGASEEVKVAADGAAGVVGATSAADRTVGVAEEAVGPVQVADETEGVVGAVQVAAGKGDVVAGATSASPAARGAGVPGSVKRRGAVGPTRGLKKEEEVVKATPGPSRPAPADAGRTELPRIDEQEPAPPVEAVPIAGPPDAEETPGPLLPVSGEKAADPFLPVGSGV